jgi:FKBP-type peptidyl-prolyl cis-trans isomerase
MKPSSSKRRQSDATVEDGGPSPVKRQKTASSSSGEQWSKPKSKKEQRQERNAAHKAKAIADALGGGGNIKRTDTCDKKGRRREEMRQERKARKDEKERALEARYREQDQMKRDRQKEQQQSSGEEQHNGKPPTKKTSQKPTNTSEPKRLDEKEKQKTKKIDEKKKQNIDGDMAVFKSIFKKSKDPSTGTTTCRLGVQYIDKKVGKGPIAQKKSLVTVKYQLRGGSPNGPLLDSSKRFKLRLGKGEVIQGWEIGLEGMQQDGVRHLIVPPKAGYGSQDIGAGSGAMLYFDITMLEVR